MLTFGSLFAGIGGMDLGLERAGHECRWQVEIDLFCRKVLAKHWPDVPRYEDVHDVGAHNLEPVDLIAGGFPCPVVSSAARGRNVGPWLWPEFARILRELRPRYALVENVDALRRELLGEVLGDLAQMGYNAEWRVLPASWFGAPHRRSRVWVVAYANSDRQPDSPLDAKAPFLQGFDEVEWAWPDPPEPLSVADGIPYHVGNSAYGNAVVPRVVEWIGRRLR